MNGLKGFRPEWLRFDLVAGLTASAVVIPKAMAYASVAGLPLEVGLYTTLVPMVVYALLGTSRTLSVSSTTTLGILTGALLSETVPAAGPHERLVAAATLAVVVGILLMAASLLRLGFLADLISEPVLTGFKAGIGLVIVLDQLPKLFGIHFPKGGFFQNLFSVFRHLSETSHATLALGALTLCLLVVLKRFLPAIPGPLVAVGLGIGATAWLGMTARGVETVGQIPVGLPHPVMPQPGLMELMVTGALGLALMSFAETIAAGRAFARSDAPVPNANRELLATGLANIAGGLFGAMPAGGGTSQTAVNQRAGARSQVAALVTAGAALATMLLLAPYLGLMPQATLAAVVIYYSVGLIQLGEFREILHIRRMEFVWAVVACVGVVLLGTLRGIAAAVVLSLVALALQVANPVVREIGRKRGTSVFRPRSPENPDDETFPGLLLLRPEGRILFANARKLAERIQPLIAQAGPRVVALDLGAVPDLEYTALKMLVEGEARWRARGVELWLVGLNPGVLEVVRRSPLGEILGSERMLFDLPTAVARYQASSTAAPAREG